MTGFDGGFFGLPFTCECRIYGETEDRKNCSKFKKRVTKSDLLNKIQSLEKENEQLQTQLLICQQSKNDDGRIKVWQVPPIPKGKRMTSSTTKRSDRI